MDSRTAFSWVLLVAALAGWIWSAPAAAEETDLFVVNGRLLDADDEPIADCRVVFRELDGTAIYLGKPSAADGSFVVAVPAGKQVVPVAVIGPRGQRVPLVDMPALEARPGADLDLRLMEPPGRTAVYEPRPFPGADRLFLAFVEDTATVDRFRFENQIRLDDHDTFDRWVSEFSASAAFRSLPRVEFGARVGYVSLDLSSGMADSSGVGDLDAWARFVLGSPQGGDGRYAFGALLTLPTGDEDEGLGAGASRSKLFAAGRWDLPVVTLSAHAGVRINEDGELFGVPLDGKIAPAAGVAAIYPLRERWVLVGEVGFEGKRFEGAEAETVVLGGVNWDAFFGGSVRAAVGVGLADGSPDTQLRLAYAVDF